MQDSRDISFFTPVTPAEISAARDIVAEYAAQLGVDLAFQQVDVELRDLPGDYAEPKGALILAAVNGHIAGCCALRPLPTADHVNAAEMKRLYVRDRYRRLGLGRQLVETVLDAARIAGYHSVLLDTLSDMEAARALYAELGFIDIPPYYYSPLAGSHYLKVVL